MVVSMASPLADHLVPRPALLAAMDTATSRRVTLISAPAGSGKSVLLRVWGEQAATRVNIAHVAVGRGEDDAAHFWTAVATAVEHAVGGATARTVDHPSATGRPHDFDRLLGVLAGQDERLVLVVDDLHELRSLEALAHLAILVDRAPTQVGFVLSTRRDPGLGLHRLRLSGSLAELRWADLRFSEGEARQLLDAEGVGLSDEGLRALHERTEGWAAGLRLAALALARSPVAERAAQAFSGSERTVADYLRAEVLTPLPDHVRRLLLDTAVLDRVSGPLADALTGADGAELVLQDLAEANAFVVPVGTSGWFRYHHLLEDLLRSELRRTFVSEVAALHVAAAEWFARHDAPVEAVLHAQAAQDWPRAARLLADNWLTLTLDGRAAELRPLLGACPARVVADDPELAVVLASDELGAGSLDRAAAAITVAERGAGSVPAERRRHAALMLALVRLRLARQRGDARSVEKQVRLLQPLQDSAWSEVTLWDEVRALGLHDLGITALWSKRFGDDDRHLREGLQIARRIDRPWLQVSCLGHLAMAGNADSYAVARQRCQEAIDIAESHGWADDVAVGPAYATLTLALTALGRWQEAATWLDRATRVTRSEVEPATRFLVELGRGLLHAGRGEHRQALSVLRAAERDQGRLATPHAWAEEVNHLRLQTQVRVGELDAVRSALEGPVDEQRLGAHARISLATLLLAEDEPARVVEVLAPVLTGVERLSRVYRIEAVLLTALACSALSDDGAVGDLLERALDLAEPDGLLWPFLVLPTGALLAGHARHRTRHGALMAQIADGRAGDERTPRPRLPPLAEPLSTAELRVLGFLPTNLSASEIAVILYLSVNTVKTHMRHVYGKLGVHGRSQAVQRSRELNLLAPSVRNR